MTQCKQCNIEFVITGNRKTFCSDSCRINHHNGLWHKYGEAARQKRPGAVMLRSAKHRAKRDGLPFDITLEDIIIPELCPVLGIPLVCNAGTGGAKQDSPSLDKIVPELGYVKGNVQVISYLANAMKSDASPEQLVAFGQWAIQTYSNKGNIE